MVAAILDSVVLKPGGMLTIGNIESDKVQEIPTYTCAHCNRVVAMRPDRTRERATCRKCMGRICDLCAQVGDCHVFEADVARALRDEGGQPWLLRHGGEPVDRLYLPDGTERLVLRRDHNLSLRERTRHRRDHAAMR